MSESTYRDVGPEMMVPISDAARRLGVAIETVRRWENEGKIKSTRTPGGQRRFEISEIERVKAGKPAEAVTTP